MQVRRFVVAGVALLATVVSAQDFDQKVFDSQKWLNSVYGGRAGFNNAPENGKTGWPTMYAFTRALQLEVGIAPGSTADNFGDGTLALVTSVLGEVGPGTRINVIRIVQGALYCKGYSGGDLSGTWADSADSVLSLRHNMGFSDSKSTVSPKEFKALLTMDAYVVVSGGRSSVRTVQQWMNANYISQSWFYIIPCDGFFGRTVNQMLVRAIQTYLGLSADGGVGPATRAGIKAAPTVSFGSSGTWARLFQAALVFNGYDVPFDGTFGQAHSSACIEFQQFYKLSVVGAGNYETWLSLLISTGDPERSVTGADCASTVTAARASTLYNAGYRAIGRYLSNVSGSSFNKKIQPGELGTIFSAGLRVFPLFETSGDYLEYFHYDQGVEDAKQATSAATLYGFRRGTVIYFAVDFDATDYDIDTRVIPYFQGINLQMSYLGNKYRIGVYASRNPCTQLHHLGLADFSFTADLSTGFSGNLGYGLPPNWAFSQIATVTVNGSQSIEIDKDVASGRDMGVSSVDCVPGIDTNFNYDYKAALLSGIKNFAEDVDPTNQIGLIRSYSESLDKILEHDEYFTDLANSYGLRKALIQVPAFWEHWKETYLDIAADANVQAYYNWKTSYEAWESLPIGPAPEMPITARDDCSTGIAQIFAVTAIKSYNWGRQKGLTNEAARDLGNWHDMNAVWKTLHENDQWSIRTIPLILMAGADEYNITYPSLEYSDAQIQQILQRYNGYGDGAVTYGKATHYVYTLFEKYNSLSRNGTICA